MKFFNPAAKIILLIVVFFLANPNVNAQRWKLRRYEVSLNLGTMQAFGDFGTYPNGENWLGLKDINPAANRVALGFSLRYKIDPLYAVSLHGGYGWAYGDDGEVGVDDHCTGRAFNTNIYEVHARYEYFLIPEDRSGLRSAAMFNKRGMVNNYRSISAYAFLGIGGMYMQPDFISREGIDYDNSEDPSFSTYKTIDDPNTEYSNFNLVVPIGLGGRYVLNDKWVLGAEVGWRWTSTDFIDGFTTTGEANKSRDVYYFLMFNITHRIKTTRRGLPAFMDRSFQQVRRSKKAI